IDDRPPDAPPFGGWTDVAAEYAAFRKGALTGIFYSVAGTIKSIPHVLRLIGTGGQAYVQLLVEREAELWNAVREVKDAGGAANNYVEKNIEFMLRDFEAVGKVPGALKNALEGFDKSSQRTLDAMANKWAAGNWVEAADELGQGYGQIVGDVGLGDVILAK